MQVLTTKSVWYLATLSAVSFLLSTTAVSLRPLPQLSPFPRMPPHTTDLRCSLQCFASSSCGTRATEERSKNVYLTIDKPNEEKLNGTIPKDRKQTKEMKATTKYTKTSGCNIPVVPPRGVCNGKYNKEEKNTNIVVQIQCRIFFVSYLCNVTSSPSPMSVEDPNSTLTRTSNRRFIC